MILKMKKGTFLLYAICVVVKLKQKSKDKHNIQKMLKAESCFKQSK